MNKTKRNLQLSAAIVGICLSGILIISIIYAMAVMSSLLVVPLYIVIFTYLFIFGLGIANIIVCSFICKNPVKNGEVNNYTGLTITSIVLNGLLFILSLGGWYWILPLIVCGLMIASLCLKNTSTAPATAPVTDPVIAPATAPATTNVDVYEARVEQLKKLQSDGVLTEAEVKQLIKQLILKEIEK